MIIVIGSIRARPDSIDDVLRLSIEHVHRSRREPGCRLHSVHQDVEDPNRVVFVEYWDDVNALTQHFGVAESNPFVEAVSQLAADPPTIEIYDAARANLGSA